MPILQRFEKLSYESQMVVLICFLGTIRVAIAVILDLRDIRLAEITVDVILLLLFISLSYFWFNRKVTSIHPVIGVVLTLLLALNFVQFGGVTGYTKFNYYAGLYVIIMLFSGWRLYTLVAFHLLVLAVILFIEYINPTFFRTLFISKGYLTIEFWFTLVTLAIFTYYLKYITNRANVKLDALGADLNEKVREAKTINGKLVGQKEELTSMRKNLETEVARRTEELQRRNFSIEEYIHYNSVQLQDPIRGLLEEMQKLEGDTQYKVLLRNSGDELKAVSMIIKDTLFANKPLVRDHIKKYGKEAGK
jgi:hypothetical protein